MILDGLRPLYLSMRSKNELRCRFSYNVNKIKFDVFFFIDNNPFKLLLIVHEHNFVIDLEVKNGFSINPYLDQNTYNQLSKLLRDGESGKNPLKTIDFFTKLNLNIPQKMPFRVKPHEVPKAYYKNIEEADKRFYFGSIMWGPNNPNGSARYENLLKTKLLLGNSAYQVFKKHHISSKWTDDPNKAIEFSLDEVTRS